MKITVTREYDITQDDLMAIMDTALDEIYYWCNDVEVLANGSDFGNIEENDRAFVSAIVPSDGMLGLKVSDEEKRYKLTRDSLLAGLKTAIERGIVEAPDKHGDWLGNIDASDADCILQLATFNEIIYG